VPHSLPIKLAEAWPTDRWRDVTVLVAVSGGADSVALLRALAELASNHPGSLVVGHFNHRLRGAESDHDEAFVVELAGQLGIACEVGRAEPSAPSGDGIEADARRQRYDFLQATAERLGARYVATAHTADDQAETILHRIVRGTGLSGLAGIRRARPLGPAVALVRPLLDVSRAEVLDYLGSLGQTFREDATNQQTQFTRNLLRHELLPLLARQYNPRVADALRRLGTLAGEAQEVIDREVQRLQECYVGALQPGRIEIDLAGLADQPPYLVRELLLSLWRKLRWPQQSMGHHEWSQLARLARSGPDEPGPGKSSTPLTLPGAICAEKQGEQLVLTRPEC